MYREQPTLGTPLGAGGIAVVVKDGRRRRQSPTKRWPILRTDTGRFWFLPSFSGDLTSARTR